jgi:DNA-binding NtrC family response regulator
VSGDARIADIVPIAEHFLNATGHGKSLSADAAARLIRYHWPGNVRELKNAMERGTVMARGSCVTSVDLEFLDDMQRADPINWPDEDLPSAVARLEEVLIRRALARNAGNRTEAAKTLNINRQLLYAKLKRYGLASLEDVNNEGASNTGSS